MSWRIANRREQMVSRRNFIVFFDFLADDLLEVLNTIFDLGQMSTSQRTGLITMLYKKGDHFLDLKNWRPISLLNCDYKI